MLKLLHFDMGRLRGELDAGPKNVLQLEFELTDPALPLRLAGQAHDAVKARLAEALDRWQAEQPHMTRANRLAEDVAECERQIASLDADAASLRSQVDECLFDGRDPSKAEDKLAQNRLKRQLLADRRATLQRLSAEALQQARTSLLTSLGAAVADLRVSATGGWREANQRLTDAVAGVASDARQAWHELHAASDPRLVELFLEEAGVKLPPAPAKQASPDRPLNSQ